MAFYFLYCHNYLEIFSNKCKKQKYSKIDLIFWKDFLERDRGFIFVIEFFLCPFLSNLLQLSFLPDDFSSSSKTDHRTIAMLLPVVVSPPSPSTSNGLLLYYYYYYYYYYYCYCNSIITIIVTGNFSAHKHSLRHYYVAIGSMSISLCMRINHITSHQL